MEQRLQQGLTALGLTPPPKAVAQLIQYGHSLVEQNKVMNLTAITSDEGVADLHFLDSVALLTMHSAPEQEGQGTWLAGKSLIDVGTGAGFPGLPLKIMEPTLEVTLLDSLAKRISWLDSLCSELGLSQVECLHARSEEQGHVEGYRESYDFATSRAVASLGLLCELALPYVKVGGQFLALKSTESTQELEEAAKAIQLLGGQYRTSFDYTIPKAGVTHRILVIDKIAPTPSGYPRRWAKIQKNPL